jgi:hypothetical protein
MGVSSLMGKLPASLSPGLLVLGQELATQNQDALGWLCSTTRNVVSYSDPQTRQRVQHNLDHAVGLLCVAHIMAVFELGFPNIYWPVILDPADVRRLFAYRHIRCCAANGFTGVRPQDDYADFDLVMASDLPLRGVINHTDKAIVLSLDVLSDLSLFTREVINKAIVAAHHQ